MNRKEYTVYLIIVTAFVCSLFWIVGFLCGKTSAENEYLKKAPAASSELILAGLYYAPVEIEKAAETEKTSLGEFTLTAYCPCSKCCGKYAKNRPTDAAGAEVIYTSSGERAEPGCTVAVDPKIIPYGTQLLIDGKTYIAQDSGSAVKGKVIDIMFSSHSEAEAFGKQSAEVFIIKR